MLRLKAKELADNPEFKASLGWYQNWKRRHSVSMRTKTTLAQRLPNEMAHNSRQVFFLGQELLLDFATWLDLTSNVDNLLISVTFQVTD